MIVSDLVPRWSRSLGEAMGPLARCLRQEGVDLLELGDNGVERGTPVYVDAAAGALEVQELMARHHIRMLPVICGDSIIGVVDLVELAAQSETLIESARVFEVALLAETQAKAKAS